MVGAELLCHRLFRGRLERSIEVESRISSSRRIRMIIPLIALLNQKDLVLEILDLFIRKLFMLISKPLQTYLLSYKNKFSLAFETLLTKHSLMLRGYGTVRIPLLKREATFGIRLEGGTLRIGRLLGSLWLLWRV